jgi:hypothetical protein
MSQEHELEDSLNTSQHLKRRNDRKAEQLLTMSQYQRTGGGYNRSTLMHMISVNMKLD